MYQHVSRLGDFLARILKQSWLLTEGTDEECAPSSGRALGVRKMSGSVRKAGRRRSKRARGTGGTGGGGGGGAAGTKVSPPNERSATRQRSSPAHRPALSQRAAQWSVLDLQGLRGRVQGCCQRVCCLGMLQARDPRVQAKAASTECLVPAATAVLSLLLRVQEGGGGGGGGGGAAGTKVSPPNVRSTTCQRSCPAHRPALSQRAARWTVLDLQGLRGRVQGRCQRVCCLGMLQARAPRVQAKAASTACLAPAAPQLP